MHVSMRARFLSHNKTKAAMEVPRFSRIKNSVELLDAYEQKIWLPCTVVDGGKSGASKIEFGKI